MKQLGHVSGALIVVACTLLFSGCAALLAELQSQDPADLSTPADGLREALRVGTGRAVEQLGRADGYLGVVDLRIPVPDKLDKIAGALRAIGADDYVNDFVTSMNRAAEAAAPVARGVFVDSIREMTFSDAMTILRGHEHEATDYFHEQAGPRLADLFRPIVEEKLGAVGATRSFSELMDQTSRLPFVGRPAFDLTSYVTDRALDGLFLTIAKEEERIRHDPIARTTELLKRYFGK